MRRAGTRIRGKGRVADPRLILYNWWLANAGSSTPAATTMKVFYSETHRRHDPPFEVIDGGQRNPYLENPGRMDSILAALHQTNWAEVLEPVGFGMEPLRAVHSQGYLDFLASA